MDMDTTLSNSFFYFFSAVPQVLAAILGLFAVFVLYRIQTLKDDLINLASEFVELLNSLEKAKNIMIEKRRTDVIKILNNAIQVKNILIIHYYIEKMTLNTMNNDDKVHIDLCKRMINGYNTINSLRESFPKKMIILSSFTALVILMCLSVIPFACYIFAHPVLLNWLFIIIVIAVIVCFVLLINILRKAFPLSYMVMENSNPIS